MRFAFERLKIVLEPSGAAAIAAVMNGKIPSAGKRIGVIISGGNVDAQRFGSLLSE
jgi:threonine dehydratase